MDAQQGLDLGEFGFGVFANLHWFDFAIAGFQFRLARLKAALAACILHTGLVQLQKAQAVFSLSRNLRKMLLSFQYEVCS